MGVCVFSVWIEHNFHEVCLENKKIVRHMKKTKSVDNCDLLLYSAYCRYGQAMPKKGNVTKVLCLEFDGKRI